MKETQLLLVLAGDRNRRYRITVSRPQFAPVSDVQITGTCEEGGHYQHSRPIKDDEWARLREELRTALNFVERRGR